MSLLVDFSKSRKVPVAVAEMAEAEVDKTMYFWSYGQANHTKKDCPSKERHAQTVGNPYWKLFVPAKDSTKGTG